MYNKYPYTDFHELNLDWFLAQFKELIESWDAQKVDYNQFKLDVTTEFNTLSGKFDTLEETVQTFTTFVENYFENLDVQQEINNKLAAMSEDGTLQALLEPFFNDFVEDTNDRMDVLEGRMDAFSALAEGSTTGDAELQDIRVGNSGHIYPTAGDAVRGQVDILQDEIDNISSLVMEPGDAITFPTDYTGNVNVEAISGRILTGGHNIIDYIGFVDGTYTLNDITITVSGNTLTVNGTASASVYFNPHTGVIQGSSTGLSDETDYTLPAVNYKFGAEFTDIPGSVVSVSIRSRISGNVASTQSNVPHTDAAYDASTWANIYVFIQNGAVINNGTIQIGIVPDTVYQAWRYFTEYDTINEITAPGNNSLSVYSILDGTATVKEPSKSVIPKGKYIRYISGAGLDESTERLEVYMPADYGYIRYDFVHSVSVDKHCDIWRVGYAYAVDDDFTQRFPVTTQGEWECALKLYNRPDFSGGYLHGNEIMNNISFIVDGVPSIISDFTNITRISDLKIIQTSDLYDPDDGITIVAEHGSQHHFSGKLIISQSVNWKISERLSNCYLAMFPVAKSVTNKFYTDKNYDIATLPNGVAVTVPQAKNSAEYSESSGFFAGFSVGEYPSGMDPAADLFLTTDNGSVNAYHKCYYMIISQNNNSKYSAEDEFWRSETYYDLNITK